MAEKKDIAVFQKKQFNYYPLRKSIRDGYITWEDIKNNCKIDDGIIEKLKTDKPLSIQTISKICISLNRPIWAVVEVNFNYIKKEHNATNNITFDSQIEKEAIVNQNPKNEKKEIIEPTSDKISVSNKNTTVELPCRIGGMAWCIRNYCGAPQPMQGIIHEMAFDHSMQLIISVYHIGKGIWGKKVFATEEEAWEAIRNKKKKQQKYESE